MFHWATRTNVPSFGAFGSDGRPRAELLTNGVVSRRSNLACREFGRFRVSYSWTSSSYVNNSGACCAWTAEEIGRVEISATRKSFSADPYQVREVVGPTRFIHSHLMLC